MRRKLRRAGLAAGATAGVLLALGLLLVAFFRWSWVEEALERRASSDLGRELRIGELSGSLAFEPRLVARDVRVANAAWSESDEPLLAAERVELDVELLDLVGAGEPIRSMTLHAPRLSLERSAAGRVNWRLRPGVPSESAPVAPDSRESPEGGAAPPLARVVVEGGRVTWLEPGRARLEITASGSADWAARPPSVRGRLGWTELDLTQYVLGGRGGGGDRSALPSGRFQAARLRELELRLELEGGAVRLPFGGVESVRGTASLAGGALALDLEGEAASGRWAAGGRARAAGDTAEHALRLELDGVDLARLIAGTELAGDLAGVLEARVSLTGRGTSVAEVLGSADGSACFVVERGLADERLVEKIGLEIPELLVGWLWGDDRSEIDCLVAGFDVAGGVWTVSTLVCDVGSTKVVGHGRIDFAAQRVDLVLEPRAIDFGLLSGEAPVRIHGPFGAIVAEASTTEAVQSLLTPIELGGAEPADCAALSESVRRRQRERAPELAGVPNETATDGGDAPRGR